MPAWANVEIIFSASPPSAGMTSPSEPWSENARSVASGIVLMVKGAASALTWITSEAAPTLPLLTRRGSCWANPGR